MANIYSIASGNASSTSVWNGGVVPASGDRVLISAGHTVTLDGTYTWGDDTTSTISFGSPAVSTTAGVTLRGKLQHPRNANSQLTLRGGMNVDAGGEHNMGEQGDPIQDGYTAELTLNFSSAPSVGKYRVNFNSNSKWKMWGQTKKRHTKLSATAAVSATTIYVTDATGWKSGDELYLASTANGTGDQQELATIHASYTPGSLTVPLVSALTKQHLNKGPVANLTSNVRYRSYNTGGVWYDGQLWGSSGASNATGSMALGYCSLDGISAFSGENTVKGLFISCDANYSQTPLPQAWAFTGVAFVCRGTAAGGMLSVWSNSFPYASRIPFTSCAFVNSQATSQSQGVADFGFTGYWDCLFAAATAFTYRGSISSYLDQPVFCGTIDWSSVVAGEGRNVQIERAFYTGPSYGLAYSCGTSAGSGWSIDNSDVAETFTARAGEPVVKIANAGTSVTLSMKNSHFGSYPIVNGAAAQKAMSGASYIKVINKNRDVTAQEEYYATGSVYRDNYVKNRSTSSLRIEPLVIGGTFSRSQEVNCANGASIRLVGYAQRDTATSTAKVTISGLGITPVVYTLSAGVNTWQQFDLQATNSAGYDGAFTVTYENTDSASATSKAYFDGVPFSPFVTFARHYGFAFDEANPSRVVNPIVTASESTAYAYTGVTINSATPQITVSSGTANTFKKVYDYIQAWACVNLDKAVLFTSNDGSNFSVPLTCKVSWPGMGTDGTLSGGWLLLGTPGTINHKLSGTKIDFTAAGTYNMGGSTFSGTVELVNSSGGAVTVALPTGTSYTNTGPSITVTTPQPTLTIGLPGTGFDVVVLQAGTSTVLASVDAEPTSSWSYTYSTLQNVDIGIFKPGYVPTYVRNYALTAGNATLPITAPVDRNYA